MGIIFTCLSLPSTYSYKSWWGLSSVTSHCGTATATAGHWVLLFYTVLWSGVSAGQWEQLSSPLGPLEEHGWSWSPIGNTELLPCLPASISSCQKTLLYPGCGCWLSPTFECSEQLKVDRVGAWCWVSLGDINDCPLYSASPVVYSSVHLHPDSFYPGKLNSPLSSTKMPLFLGLC